MFFISASIFSTISSKEAFTSDNLVAFFSNSPSSSAAPSFLILLPKDFPVEFAISIIFTGSIVDKAAKRTKKAKRSVIISANVPNHPGKPSSTRPIPFTIPALKAFFSPDVLGINYYYPSFFHSAGGMNELSFSLTIRGCFF